MSRNPLNANELYDEDFAAEQAEDEELFDEKQLAEESESDDPGPDIEFVQSVSQRVLDATQLYLGEIGFSPLLSAEEEVFFCTARPAG